MRVRLASSFIYLFIFSFVTMYPGIYHFHLRNQFNDAPLLNCLKNTSLASITWLVAIEDFLVSIR